MVGPKRWWKLQTPTSSEYLPQPSPFGLPVDAFFLEVVFQPSFFRGANCVPVLAVFSLMSWRFPAKWRVRSFCLPASVSFMSRWRISRLKLYCIQIEGCIQGNKSNNYVIIGNTKWIKSENAQRKKICLLCLSLEWQGNDSICKPTSDLLQSCFYAYPCDSS